MSNAPVYYALAQVKFNLVANIDSYIHLIQDKFRLSAYTLFETQKIAQLQFGTSQSSEAKIINLPLWSIAKSDQTAGFVLGQSHLGYHTTHYQTHEELFSELLLGLKIVHELINLEHLSRVGLRYLNAVVPAQAETVNHYLINGLHGICLDVPNLYSFSESVFDTTKLFPCKGTLIHRIHHRLGEIALPPDIASIGLRPMRKFMDQTLSSNAVIDLDHFIEGRMSLNFREINAHLGLLHGYVQKAFQSTITKKAQDTWNV